MSNILTRVKQIWIWLDNAMTQSFEETDLAALAHTQAFLGGKFFFMFMQANIETWQLNSSRFAWTKTWEISSSSCYEIQHAVKRSFFSNWNTTTCCIWRNVKARRDQGLGMGQDMTSICWMCGYVWGQQPLTSISATRLTDPSPRTKPSKCCRAKHITAALSATPAYSLRLNQNPEVRLLDLCFHWSCASINSRKDYYKSQHAHTAFHP